VSPRKIISIIIGLMLVLTFWGKSFFLKHPIFSGSTMGTRYNVTISGYVSRKKIAQIYQAIDTELIEISRQMSTWEKESEISRFNHSNSTEPFETSIDFATVVQRALKLSQSTGGAFDPTLQPLLNLWGFGSEGTKQQIPADTEIAKAKALTGWRKLKVIPPSSLKKSIPELSLDLGAIAKGYGVDALGKVLSQAGATNWFVEIGGEVIVQGLNPAGVPWRVGIQYPTTNPMDTRLQGILHITTGAVATSGTYRNYIEQDGVLYSHILDPRSGRAVLSNTASVTVFTTHCMDADGIATALFVMGPDEGLAWVEKHTEVEAMFLVRGSDDKIFEKFSSGFIAVTGYIPES
jgi:thiamine biosynthesis lipoprotein